MKKILLILLSTLLFVNCDIGGSSDKKDKKEDPVVDSNTDVEPEPVDPKKDVSLKTITVNGEQVDLSSGGSDFDFYLISSGYPGHTPFEVKATTNNASAKVIGGIGSNSVINPIVAQPVDGVTEQRSGEKLVVITVKSEDGTITKEYNLRIYSAPAWIRFPLKYSSEKNFKNKKAYFFIENLNSVGVFGSSQTPLVYKYSTTIYKSKPNYLYMSFPKEGFVEYTLSSIVVSSSGVRDEIYNLEYQDITGFHQNSFVVVSKSIINESPLCDLYSVNRLKALNIPDDLFRIDTNSGEKETTLFMKNNETGEFFSLGIFYINNSSIKALEINRYGSYELYLRKNDIKEVVSDNCKVYEDLPMVSLGVYNITEKSDISKDLNGITPGKVSDFALNIQSYNLDNRTIVFSEAVDKSSFESSLTIKEYGSNGSEVVDVSFTVSMSSDNKTVSVIPLPTLDPTKDHCFIINKKLKSVSGKQMLEEKQLYYHRATSN